MKANGFQGGKERKEGGERERHRSLIFRGENDGREGKGGEEKGDKKMICVSSTRSFPPEGGGERKGGEGRGEKILKEHLTRKTNPCRRKGKEKKENPIWFWGKRKDPRL